MTHFESVKKFQDKTKFRVNSLTPDNRARIEQRIRLIAEEVQELFAALGYDSTLEVFPEKVYESIYCRSVAADPFDAEHILKEACDVGIVVEGTVAEFGWNYDQARERVDANNMTKVKDVAIYDRSGKLQKPYGYQKVDLKDLV